MMDFIIKKCSTSVLLPPDKSDMSTVLPGNTAYDKSDLLSSGQIPSGLGILHMNYKISSGKPQLWASRSVVIPHLKRL